jgi:hypothetical protein
MDPLGSRQFPEIKVEADNSGVKLSTQAIKNVDANGQNIIRAIDHELDLAGVGPNDTVECHGMCERENPENLESPIKIRAFYNESKGKAFYEVALVWEIKITKEDGTVQRINVHQDRVSDREVPKVHETMQHTDQAYIIFSLGNEYAKTISAIYDSKNPEHDQMQEAKKKLIIDDFLYITIKHHWLYLRSHVLGSSFNCGDPSVHFKGYGSSSIEWVDGKGDKVKIIDRKFSKETYKVDKTANRYFRSVEKRDSTRDDLWSGLSVYQKERIKLDKKLGWFKTLNDLENITDDTILEELEKNNIKEQDWANRLAVLAPKAFQNSMEYFGRGEYKPKFFPAIANEINKLKADPAKRDDFNKIQESYDKIPKGIDKLNELANQLKLLEDNGSKVAWGQWSSKMIREKAAYMQDLYNALNGVLGTGPDNSVTMKRA